MQGKNLLHGPFTIVGGTYHERCEFPPWHELYGSGLRAAASLAARDRPIQLHTCADARSSAHLRSVAAGLRITTAVVPSPHTPSFHYLHPLAVPAINHYTEDHPSSRLEVTADTILRYGMLEAEAVVHGRMVVYDPQSPYLPQPFKANGSSAEHLAIVANRQEAAQMAGTWDLDEAGIRLREQAAVVVVKDGPNGAMVFDESGKSQIPVFRTSQTFSIGSGDIFSAVFAFEWMVNNIQPSEAARLASLATAWYCQSRMVPLPFPLPENFHLGPHVPRNRNEERSVYLAGPFFNLMQLWCVQEVRSCLRALGLKVFSPRHDVGMRGSADVIARADLEGLEGCEMVFAILDGHDPGTIFEIGYARARGKPVVLLVSNSDATHLTMFEGTGCQVFSDIASAVYAAAWMDV